jgi:hypothetical protein
MMLSTYNHAEKLQLAKALQAYNEIFVEFILES